MGSELDLRAGATFFSDLHPALEPVDIVGARCLVKVGDSITTDHISLGGATKVESPAGRYLIERGVEQRDFNSYGARRGNHEVMMRGTSANVRLRNDLAQDREGPWTTHLPDGEVTTVYDARCATRRRGCLVVLAEGVRRLLAGLGRQGPRSSASAR